MQLETDGAQHFPGAALPVLPNLFAAFQDLEAGKAGVRLAHAYGIADVLSPQGAIGAIAARFRGNLVRPVRAVLFDKTPARNWGLGWHQDRTICVKARHDTPGFGPWTIKAGLTHVAPPFSYIERMITLRVHLDDVTHDNAPLQVALGSHSLGRIPAGEVEAVVARCHDHACLARAGDIWAYATPILHASDAAIRPARRRVLQIDYSADELPDGLNWLGVT
ncbi:phytanoyl-CoA dioxygenase family protein [Novosphingobium sp.]|uniref:phytanoyl-CoA dioxygenase family protein n=1 Tax=Novosphingobium sp. TaxID=1874826 RepID=UPI002602A7E3|nr:phytanoyl-CoA dioxygenase family protein [Novosphingobium sp.]